VKWLLSEHDGERPFYILFGCKALNYSLLVDVMEASRGSRGIVSLISVLGGDGWLTSRPGRFTPGKERLYPLSRKLGGSQSRPRRLGEETNFWSIKGFEVWNVWPWPGACTVPAPCEAWKDRPWCGIRELQETWEEVVATNLPCHLSEEKTEKPQCLNPYPANVEKMVSS
jgi:hypothetical protein